MIGNKRLNKEQALHKAAALCSQKECCPYDIIEKFNRWGVETEDREPILEYLTEQHYIDIDRFARSFVKDKFRFDGWGKEKIKYHLKQKRIPSGSITQAFLEIDQEEYETKLQNLIKQKLAQTKTCSAFEMEGKLYRFASSRGFESDLILKTLKKLELKNGEKDE